MNTITEIKNYILFLKEKCNLEITLHTYENEHFISSCELIAFNIHGNPHCIYIKTFPNAFRHCVKRQSKIKDKCKNGSFCGTCYAGVFEYVYPIYDGVSQVGFICVSGYRNDNCNSYIERASKVYSIPIKNLRKTSLSLKNNIPDKAYVDTLITPLLRMLELAYSKSSYNISNADYVDIVIKYINRHYAENITLNRICTELSCSRSSISHNFKKVTGKGFREYLNSVRLESAKSLLQHTKLSIIEISYAVGFNDSNYFSYIFKSHTGMSPGMYRKKNM